MKTIPQRTPLAIATAILMGAMLAAGATGAADPQPYSGFQDRPIKALSAEQIDDYRNGRGMSLALAAELNGYPGPRHVLDLAEHLALTPSQQAEAQALFEAMRREAVDLGERIVAREVELDRLFADARAMPESVEALSISIGRLNGQLRAAHLRYHISMRQLLGPAQIDAYADLRGYRSQPQHLHGHEHGEGH